MIYNLAKSMHMHTFHSGKYKVDIWNSIKYIVKACFVICVWYLFGKISRFGMLKFFRYDVEIISKLSWQYYWETRQEYYQFNDEFRGWLTENKIWYYQSLIDIGKGRYRFYFWSKRDMMAFKLRWL